MPGRWVVLLLVLGLSGLRALASANPPDPVWVPGFYDDADYDDVVEAVLSENGLRDDSPPTLERPAPLAVRMAAPSPARPSSAPRRSQNSRAPPAS
jgi:hypothetical protein